MALRANDPDTGKITNANSAVAGFALYWNDPHQKPSIEWKKWCDLFVVAMTAKYSISIAEVLRTVTNETDRNKALLKNFDQSVAERMRQCPLLIPGGRGAKDLH